MEIITIYGSYRATYCTRLPTHPAGRVRAGHGPLDGPAMSNKS